MTLAEAENARVFGKHNVVQYLVYPDSLSRINILERDIEVLFDHQNVQVIRDYRFAIRFWLIVMTFPQYNELRRRHPEIIMQENVRAVLRKDAPGSGLDTSSNISSNDNSMFNSSHRRDINPSSSKTAKSTTIARPDDTVLCQSDASDNLKVVSWPKTRMFSKTVSQIFSRLGFQVSWIYGAPGGLDDPTLPVPTDHHPRSHGSCVASLAAGTKNGVSKYTSIVVVKSAEYIADVEWAFLAIEKNMRQHPARRAVIVFASASDNIYGPTTLVPYPWLSIREIMKSIIDLNGIIVVGAGNRRDGGTRRVVDTLPALFNGPDLPLVVAGSVDNGGILAPFSQGPDHVDTWAPGVEVSCTRPIMAAQMGTGTSYSAGMVAGLAAYFLGFADPPFPVGAGSTARNFKTFLGTKASWRRRPMLSPNVIWNRENGFRSLLRNSDMPLPSNISTS
ncbi:hypothetical protein G7Y79_00018g045040 [Physcia stellaris]|nr:hypothetical protein G7Y79_00018g045040 [Physcia stellaris]